MAEQGKTYAKPDVRQSRQEIRRSGWTPGGERDVYTMTFPSLAAYANLAPTYHRRAAEEAAKLSKRFTAVDSLDEAVRLCEDGWKDKLPAVEQVLRDAVETVERHHPVPTFEPLFDVSGMDVDIARFLSDEPENMIDLPLRQVVRAGRVITLCASVSASSGVSTDSLIRRGQTVAGLALALNDLGYNIEIISDLTIQRMGGRGNSAACVRTVVKSAYDFVSPEHILYALAHPSMLRILGFSSLHGMPANVRSDCNIAFNGRYGIPTDPPEDLPEGTIYLPCVISNGDVPNADEAIVQYLKQLEIIPEDDRP